MTRSILLTVSFRKLALVAVAALAPLAMVTTAQAGGRGKEHFVQDYTFKKPMNGYSGRQGDYYCDYIKIPNRQCDRNGRNCKIVSWTLRQTCY